MTISALNEMNDSQQYFMCSERLGFRCWRTSDIDLALALWGDEQVTQFIDARGKLTDEHIHERLAREIAMEIDYGVQYWPIFRLLDDEHIGCCGLRPYDVPNDVYEIGFHIRSGHWRKGYATEAARATIRYGFSALNAKSLFAGHHPKNQSSRALLNKLGFEYTRDEFYEPTGLHHPSYMLYNRGRNLQRVE